MNIVSQGHGKNMDQQAKFKQKVLDHQAMMCLLTKREADLIVQVMNWDQDTRVAFMVAKASFEAKLPLE